MPTTMQNKVTTLRQILRSKAGKVFVACWAISVFGFAGFMVFGITDGDIAGAVAVGVLVVAPLIDIALLASHWMDRVSQFMARATWGVISVALLVSTQSLLGAGKSDADLLLTYGAAILGFPLGLIGAPLAGQFSMPAGQALTMLIWALTIGIGCLQWFVLIPALLKTRARAKE